MRTLKFLNRTWVRLIIAPDDHEKMRSVRSADRRTRPRVGVLYRAGPPLEAAPFFGPTPKSRAAAADDSRFQNLAEIIPWIVRVPLAPLLHQSLKLGMVP